MIIYLPVEAHMLECLHCKRVFVLYGLVMDESANYDVGKGEDVCFCPYCGEKNEDKKQKYLHNRWDREKEPAFNGRSAHFDTPSISWYRKERLS